MSPQVATSRLSENILNEILKILYVDFLESEESIGVDEHHCSLLYPCVSISRSPAFEVFYVFRLISSIWNKTFQKTVKLDGYPLHPLVEGPRHYQTSLYTLLRKSVIFGRYRVFNVLENESAYRGVFVAHDFGVTGGCKESREVVVKAWRDRDDHRDEYLMESRVYKILSTSPMKGVPSLIESDENWKDLQVYTMVLEKLGPSLEDLRRLMPDKRFDEKMILALAIQMVDRYAALHARGIIHNGVKPGNICLAPFLSNATDATTLNLIDFGYSFVHNSRKVLLRRDEGFGGNRRFWSALSDHGFTQSQRDDLESLGYLFSALFHGSLPWWYSDAGDICSIKMTTPGSVLFHDMDPSFLEYWKDVRSLAFCEVPNYCSLKSRFVQCWERKGLGNLPGEYDWLSLFKRLHGDAESLDKSGFFRPVVHRGTSVAKHKLSGSIPKPGSELTPALLMQEIKKSIDTLTTAVEESLADPVFRLRKKAVHAISVQDDGLSFKEKVTILNLFTDDYSSIQTYVALLENDKMRRQWLLKQLE